jgi:threonine dehydratase
VSIVQLAAVRRQSLPCVTLDSVRAAQTRIAPYIRYTPIMKARLGCAAGNLIDVSMKLENLQIAETFAVRGVVNAALERPYADLARGLVGYGSRHGAAIAYAGHVLDIPTTVYLPAHDGPTSLVPTLEGWGATIIRAGRTRDDAQRLALEHAERNGLCFIYPWGPGVLAGCGTLGLELLEGLPHLDILVTYLMDYAILLAGVAVVIKQVRPHTRVIGVDHESSTGRRSERTERERLIAVGKRHMRPVAMHQQIIERYVDDIVFVSQAEAAQTACMLWSELEIRSGDFSSSAIAAILTGKIQCAADQEIAAIIPTGGGKGMF